MIRICCAFVDHCYSFHMPLFIFVNGYFARKSSKPAEAKSLKMLKYYLLMQVLFMLGDWLIAEKEFEISILSIRLIRAGICFSLFMHTCL